MRRLPDPKHPKKWRCYVCGDKIFDLGDENTQFLIFSLAEETDRTFLCHYSKSCYARLDQPVFIVLVSDDHFEAAR